MLLLRSIFTWSATTILLQTSSQGRTPIGVILILVLLVIVLYWWGINRPSYDQITQHDDDHDTAHSHPPAAETHDRHQTIDIQAAPEPTHEPEPVAPTTPDNLKRIEGIGPKIEKILNEAGILTFAQLAATEVSQLEKIVREDAGIRIAFPDTWPQQAQLAAAGDWDSLSTLQDNLKGGRM